MLELLQKRCSRKPDLNEADSRSACAGRVADNSVSKGVGGIHQIPANRMFVRSLVGSVLTRVTLVSAAALLGLASPLVLALAASSDSNPNASSASAKSDTNVISSPAMVASSVESANISSDASSLANLENHSSSSAAANSVTETSSSNSVSDSTISVANSQAALGSSSRAGNSSRAASSPTSSEAAPTTPAPIEPALIEPAPEPDGSIEILGQVITPNSYRRLTWSSENLMAGFSEPTPVLVVNGVNPGPTLCMVGAVHGDELNGIEMIRSVIFDIDPNKLTGTVIGVPVANIMGFRRNSRYLPDRRDWNRYFPGNTHGSTASRLAHSFFNNVIRHCDALVDIHTGSFHRTNLPQLRADLGDEAVAGLAQQFGDIAVLNSRGNPSSLRAAAVREGIPAVTMEAGEPQHLQIEVVNAGVAAIKILLAKREMYGRAPKWGRAAPVYYRSTWLRANQSGILFSRVSLGKRVREGDVLGVVTDPITNARSNIISPYHGRVLGMALDQVVLPGFAAYHIGVQTAEQILIEEGLLNEGGGEVDDEDGDDAGVLVPVETSPARLTPDAEARPSNQSSGTHNTPEAMTVTATTTHVNSTEVDAAVSESDPVPPIVAGDSSASVEPSTAKTGEVAADSANVTIENSNAQSLNVQDENSQAATDEKAETKALEAPADISVGKTDHVDLVKQPEDAGSIESAQRLPIADGETESAE